MKSAQQDHRDADGRGTNSVGADSMGAGLVASGADPPTSHGLVPQQLICRQEPSLQGIAVVAVDGEVDPLTAPDLESAVLSTIASCSPHVVVDLTDVRFMDSSGLAALLAADKHARAAGGGVRLVGVPSRIRRLLALTGLDRFFPTHQSMEELAACPACQRISLSGSQPEMPQPESV